MTRPWQLIFLQSKVNDCIYDGDRLPANAWSWPEGTWLQARLRYLRENRKGAWEPNRAAD